MDHDYELEDDYAPRVLWGRLAFFLLALVLAFVAGRACAPAGVPEDDFKAEQQNVLTLQSENAVLEQQLEAANDRSNAGNNGGNGGENNNDGGGAQPTDAPTEDTIPSGGDRYTVQENDTLTTIAEEFYGDPMKFDLIVDANNLSDDTPLRVGQELVIPEDS